MAKPCYEIRVQGWLGDGWQNWFEGLTIRQLDNKHTLLTGRMDQAMLRGVLTKISELGLTLVSVQQQEPDNTG